MCSTRQGLEGRQVVPGLSLTMADLGPHTSLLAANLASSFSGSLRSHFGLPTVISTMD